MKPRSESAYYARPEVSGPLFEQSSTYHPQRGGNSDGLHVTQAASRESDRQLSSADLAGRIARNGCVAKTDMPRTDAAPGDGARTSPDIAHARSTDPATSHKAAKSISLTNLGRTRDAILHIYQLGGRTDEELIATYRHRVRMGMDYPNASDSGIRSRRAELVKFGLVKDSGNRAKTQSGRESIVWSLA